MYYEILLLLYFRLYLLANSKMHFKMFYTSQFSLIQSSFLEVNPKLEKFLY